MSLTNHGEDKLLTLFKNEGPYYLALFTATPGETGGGTEVSGGAYARRQVTFGNPSNGSMKNSAAVSPAAATVRKCMRGAFSKVSHTPNTTSAATTRYEAYPKVPYIKVHMAAPRDANTAS